MIHKEIGEDDDVSSLCRDMKWVDLYSSRLRESIRGYQGMITDQCD
jgi:hypothetical protein